jgi:hypothetical protein
MLKAAPGERYTIRQKVFKLLGNAFHILDAEGQVIGYCKQKAFKLKEDLRVFTSEAMTTELLRIQARNVIDFGATYDVTMPGGEVLGSIRQRAMKSLLRSTWEVVEPDGQVIATIQEDSAGLAVLRRMHDLTAALLPAKFSMRTPDGVVIAEFRTHFNLWIHRMGVTIKQDHPLLDDLTVLAAGILLVAMDNRG